MAKRVTHGFRLAKMKLDFPYHPEWETQPDPAICAILQQPFHFIGKGAQCYVFESKDGYYVIKLFRYDQPHSPQKVTSLFNACKIAYDSLREETGLVYIHLNPTPMDLPTIRCKDSIGRTYAFDLNRTRFAVQKKVKPFLEALMAVKNQPHELQKRIDQLLFVLRSRTAKQVGNSDPSLSRNFGYLDDQAIELDFGNYYSSKDLNRSEEIKRYTNRLRRILKKMAPESIAYLDEQVAKLS